MLHLYSIHYNATMNVNTFIFIIIINSSLKYQLFVFKKYVIKGEPKSNRHDVLEG